MVSLLFYQKPDNILWQGRADARQGEYFFQQVKLLDLQAIHGVPPGIALLGFASDIGVRRNAGRTGAKEGSYAIKRALARLPVQHAIGPIYDAGTITSDSEDLESLQSALGQAVSHLLHQGFFPVVLGGGHEMAWGHYQGLADWLTDKPLQIINFDAHFDLRDIPTPPLGTSGTPFRQIADARRAQGLDFDYTCLGIQPYGNTQSLFNTATALNTRWLTADTIHQDPLAIATFLTPLLTCRQAIYLTLCLDVLSVTYAPGVSAPQTLGLTPWQIIPALRLLAQSGNVAGFDIAEMAPGLDRDEQTGKLAALLLSDFLHNRKINES